MKSRVTNQAGPKCYTKPFHLLCTRGTRFRIKDRILPIKTESVVLCFIKHIDINWGCWPAGSSGYSVQGWIGTIHCSASPPGRQRSSWHLGTGYWWCQHETYLQPRHYGGALRNSGHWSALLSWSRTGQILQSRTLSSAEQWTVLSLVLSIKYIISNYLKYQSKISFFKHDFKIMYMYKVHLYHILKYTF